MQFLKSVKLANSIRCGTKHPSESFFHQEKGFEMVLNDAETIIMIRDIKSGDTVWSTIYNTIYFEIIEGKKSRESVKPAAALNA